jgi:translation initiation factor 2 beta subunit (eIF-2beta)/eIF-5
MSPKVNIPRTVVDVHYRYKIEDVQLQHTDRNQMTKTIIANTVQLSKDINVAVEHVRPLDSRFASEQVHEESAAPEFIAKHMSLHFNTPATVEDDKITVKGNFTLEQVRTALDEFIEQIVLCPKCA